MSYNGWANYETWAVKLWLDNEEGSYRAMASQATDTLAEHTGPDGTVDSDGFKRAFADLLESQHKDAAGELDGINGTVFSDLLGAALSEVNWYEIAEAYLDEAKEAAAND